MNRDGRNDIGRILRENTYPGRGIVLGRSESGKAVTAYFIMGRSSNSRNRVLKMEDKVLYTRPFDESKTEDPSLIIYAALRNYENRLIVTNGDQTDTIYDYLKQGKTFEAALAARKFEPDFPNLTPRISGMITFDGGDFAYKMSILKSMDEEGRKCGRYFFDYEPEAGMGHFIHTYLQDGKPLPSFEGEPKRIGVPDSIDEFTDCLWKGLNKDNRIALYVRYTDPATGEYEERLVNKNRL